MASKVNVNNLTVVHAASSGVAPSFPMCASHPRKRADSHPLSQHRAVVGHRHGQQDRHHRRQPGHARRVELHHQHRDEAGSAGGVASSTTKARPSSSTSLST